MSCDCLPLGVASLGGLCFDDFNRTASSGRGTGLLGTWLPWSPTPLLTHDSCDGAAAVTVVTPNPEPDFPGEFYLDLPWQNVLPFEIYAELEFDLSPYPLTGFSSHCSYVLETGSASPVSNTWLSTLEVKASTGTALGITITDKRTGSTFSTSNLSVIASGVSGTHVSVRWQMDGAGTRAKLWPTASTEPTLWTLTLALSTSVTPGRYFGTDSNGSPFTTSSHTVKVYEIDWVSGGCMVPLLTAPVANQQIQDEFIAAWDGTTTVYKTRYPYNPNTIEIEAAGEGVAVAPSGYATGTFLLTDTSPMVVADPIYATYRYPCWPQTAYPYVLDDFNRTFGPHSMTTTGAWLGTASTGLNWSNCLADAASGATTGGVNGSAMYFTTASSSLDATGGGALVVPGTAPVFGLGEVWLDTKWMFTMTPSATGISSSRFGFGINTVAGAPTAYCEVFWANTTRTTHAQITLSFSGTTDVSNTGQPYTFLSNTWYRMKLHIQSGILMEVGIWPDSGSFTGYQLTRTLAPGNTVALANVAFRDIFVANGPGSFFMDQIQFDAS